ncbi:MAG: PQQ-binding-like beta-propeller repeat protein [Pirellulales bacterium]
MKIHKMPWLASPLILVCVAGGARAANGNSSDDWPQWRGPGRNGLADRSPALLNSLVGQSPLWESEPISSGDEGGRGSLVVAAGRVFGMTSVRSGSQRFDEVFCLDAGDGRAMWRSRLPEAAGGEAGSSTPCLIDGRLYAVSSAGKVYCLDAGGGNVIWEAEVSRPGQEPIASSVAVVEGVAILLADPLIGLDATTGDVLWRQDKVTGHESSPAVWRTNDRAYVLCNTQRQTLCVDPASGQIVWQVAGGGRSTPVVAQEYGGDFLVNMSGDRRGGLSAFRLSLEGPRKLWNLPAFDRASSPVVFDGHVYAIAGGSNGHGARILCVHLDTGRVAWEETADFAEVSSPVVADGKLAAVCGTFLWLVEATGEKYSLLSQVNWRVTLCTSPAIVDGRLYLRQASAVVSYDLRQ